MAFLCVFNPSAGNEASVQAKNELEILFKKNQIKADWFVSEYPHHVQDLNTYKNIENYEAIISIGGDGTLYDIVNAQMKLNPEKRIPIGIIPAGTGNSVYMDIVGREQNTEKALKTILSGRTMKIDVLKAKNSLSSFYFINILGFGFTTEVTQRAIRLKSLGKHAYSLAIFMKLLGLKSYNLQMHKKETVHQMKNTFVSILNTRFAGGNLLMAPNAKINDGLMDVIVVNDISRIDLIRTFPKIYDGTYIHSPHVQYFQTDRIKFTSTQPKILSPDGEITGKLPVEIEVIPKAISVFSPDL